jgi:hypothetical protein
LSSDRRLGLQIKNSYINRVNLKNQNHMSTLSIIAWVMLALIWTSMYVRNRKVEQNTISLEVAYTWSLINLVASVVGFILFVVDVAVKFI